MRSLFVFSALLSWSLHQPLSLPGAESGRNPEWIWSAGLRDKHSTVYFRKEFSVSQRVIEANLCGAGDFCTSRVFLNGEFVGEISNYSIPLRVKVTHRLLVGQNTIAIESRGSTGPSAVAVQITLKLSEGTHEVLSSEETWLCSTNAQPAWQQARLKANSEWQPVKTFGQVADELLPDPASDTAIDPLDDYTQWKQALGTEEGTDPSRFFVQEGFEIQRLRSAGASEGSWVSLEFDPKGRLLIGREDKGILRMSLPKSDMEEIQVETINGTLQECRGLLWAHGSLYASANNSKALYRLRDTNGDDQLDEVKKIHQSSGGVGHGRNDLALGLDGSIYLINGDAVDLPRNITDWTSPFREHARGEKTQEGHVLRLNADGSRVEIIAAGLRNPYGIAVHPSGELFTYDADAEYDMGSPWYRPTRIVHLRSGSDYGWRGVTKSWPPYYPDHADNAPSVLDIGKGSPTGVKFGTHSNFPAKFQKALFVSDWAYGRILAVHLTPRGASFAARAETFLKGQPFNVTDLDFGPDGAMYVVTGGRKTQSALYRIRSISHTKPALNPTEQQLAREAYSKEVRTLRQHLEQLHHSGAKDALAIAWPFLDSEDPAIRYAARTAIEHQPIADWADLALEETRQTEAFSAALALVRSPSFNRKSDLISKLSAIAVDEFSEEQLGMVADVYRLCIDSGFQPTSAQKQSINEQLSRLFPQQSESLNVAISQVLALVDSPGLVARVLEWIPQTSSQASRLHGLLLLRNIKHGWTPKLREAYFSALADMPQFQGGEGMPAFVRLIQADALRSLPDGERSQYEERLARAQSDEPLPTQTRPFVKKWASKDFADLDTRTSLPDLNRGKQLFREALCSRCHRVGFEGAAVGPDLTSVSRRFSRRDILESMINPSKVVAEQYRLTKLITTDGRTLTGQIIPSRDYRSPTLELAPNPLEPYNRLEIPKQQIEAHELSDTSVMPQGLLDHFTQSEIFDLLAWLESGGQSPGPK